MFKTSLRTFGAAILSLAAIASAPTASAAIVTGSWDPALPNPPFDNLGWTTTINLKVDDRCSAGAQSLPAIVNVRVFGKSFGCRESPLLATSLFSILSAEIGIYDLGTNRIVDVLTFIPASFTPLFLDLGVGGAIEFLFSSTDSNSVQGDIARTSNFQFKLALPGNAPRITYRERLIGGGFGGDFTTAAGMPTETEFSINPNSLQDQVLQRTALEVGALVFSVPEPGSFALVGLALAAAGLSASRRRAVAA